MKLHLLTFYLIFFCQLALAQDYYPPIVNYSSKEYKINKLNDDGSEIKMNPENFAVVQDQRGVMYFGNSNGILEFDGQDWDFIEVSIGNFVKSLAIDSNGVIYVGTNNDFGYLESDEHHHLIYHSMIDMLDEESQYFSEIVSIYSTKNEVFFQAQEAVYIYNIEFNSITSVFADVSFHTSYLTNGVFYVRERGKGILKWENDTFKLLKGTEYLFGTFEGTGYGCFGIHQSLYSDTLILITQEQGMFKWWNDQLIPILDPDNNYLNPLKLFHSIRLSDGNFALSTNRKGIYIIDEQGKLKKQINMATGMRTNDVKSMFEDRDQNLWLGLANGISKVNYYSPLSYFNEKSGIDGDVQTFIRFNNLLYVGTSFGLYVQNTNPEINKEFVNITNINNQVWDLKIINGSLYVATTEGIWRSLGTQLPLGIWPWGREEPKILTPVFKTPHSFSKISTINTNKIYFDPHNKNIITAGRNGIAIWDENFINQKWQKKEILSTILDIVEDPEYENIIWIGTSNSGAIRLTIEEDVIFDQYGSFDGLKSDNRTKPLLFNNTLVFGSSAGILRFIDEEEMKLGLDDEYKDDPDFYRGMFDAIPFYDSLFEAEILSITEDKNRTWFTADQKIGYYDLKEEEFVIKPFWGINYGRVNQFYLENNGVLWIGCADGLIRYKENQQKRYKSNFTSLIREVTLGKDSVVFYGGGVQDSLNPLIINYALNDIKFRFASPYFEDEHIPYYTYILEGKDDQWSELTMVNTANYTNLHEGDYIFKVKSQNIYGNYSQIAYFKFTISPPWFRTTLAYLGYVLLLIILILIAIKISSKRLKAKNEWLEGVVEERTKEISEKNVVLEHKNVEISEQKREIEDSINYAKRIQTAILPLDEEMKLGLPNSFVLFRPKDIVSGDFYWYTKHQNKLVVVCADCTGHGVPGAFMSMIGSDRLNIIVNERHETSPGKILSELNRAIKNTLKQGGGKDSTKDGMDAAICTIDLETNELVYSGAYRPLWVIKDGELTEVKATKVAVAGFTPDDQIFEEHTLKIEKGHKFYMTSDGYADQFGGERGKKYKVKALKNYLLSICDKNYGEQSQDLENEIIRWMSAFEEECEQIDDICIIGFEV